MDIYWYCSIQVKRMAGPYSYISDIGEIPIGSYVVVPFGSQNKEFFGEVLACGSYTEDSAPFPVEKTKHVIRIASAEEYDNAASHLIAFDEDDSSGVEKYIENEDWDSVLEWAKHRHESSNKDIIYKVIHCYELCVEHNMPVAALNLGTFYYNGVFLNQDYKEAFRLYKIAADAGELRGICNCGYCFYYGRHQEIDYAEAFKYFSLGALLFDDANCLYKLGDMYLEGHVTEKNEKYAYMLYTRALSSCGVWDHDDFCLADVRFRVGKCQLYGIGTGKDIESAQRLLSWALIDFYERRKTDPFVFSLIKDTRVLLNEAMNMLDKECL